MNRLFDATPRHVEESQDKLSGKDRRARRREFLGVIGIARTYQNLFPWESTNERRWVLRIGQPWPQIVDDGIYPYAVLPDGEFRMGSVPRGKGGLISHPELVGGREVIAAGMLRILRREIVCLSNESGHYAPDEDTTVFAKEALRYWGAPMALNCDSDEKWSILNGH